MISWNIQKYGRAVDTVKAKDRYIAVDHPFRIRSIQWTIANPVVPLPGNFPMFAYTALPMPELEKGVRTNILLSIFYELLPSISPCFCFIHKVIHCLMSLCFFYLFEKPFRLYLSLHSYFYSHEHVVYLQSISWALSSCFLYVLESVADGRRIDYMEQLLYAMKMEPVQSSIYICERGSEIAHDRCKQCIIDWWIC